MLNIRQLKAKRNSVKTIHKITSSMKLISITKSLEAVKSLQKYKGYIDDLKKIVNHIQANRENSMIDEYENNGTFWIVFTSDLGLAGGYNSNIIKEFNNNFDKAKDEVLIIGSKGLSNALAKTSKEKVFSHSIIDLKNTKLIRNILIQILNKFNISKMKVKVIYTEYVNQLTFQAKTVNLLPLEKLSNETNIEDQFSASIEFEPNANFIMEEILKIYIPSMLRFYYRSSLASEHTSRRISMENATTNGENMLKELNTQYNRVRQSKITQEILEIIGGSEALKN